MGLLYVFPVSEEESDFVINHDSLVLKTYGLPYIFWIYAICVIAIISFMFTAIKDPILKLIYLGDDLDALLGYSLFGFVLTLPIIILGFFFYEKRIVKKNNELKIIHKVFGLTFFSEKFELDNQDTFSITPFLSTPNVARLNSSPENMGFQNKGYFILWLKTANGKKIKLDRHSRKIDLEKLKTMLEKY